MEVTDPPTLIALRYHERESHSDGANISIAASWHDTILWLSTVHPCAELLRVHAIHTVDTGDPAPKSYIATNFEAVM
jgi:hypothetical protein